MPTTSSPPIRLRLLGRGDLTAPGGPDPEGLLARPKLFALVSFLAAAVPPGFQRRDRLVGLFWTEMDQEHARAALRQSLYRIRNFLGADAIRVRGDEEVSLATEHVACDVATFEALLSRGAHEEALDLYRGDFLDGFHLSGAPTFERWLERRRDDLRRKARETAWNLALDARSSGSVAAAGAHARRALQLASQDEAVLRQVILMLDEVGDRAGAIHEYEAFARRLREDLDLDPAPETEALVGRIRSRREIPQGVESAAPVHRGPSSMPSEAGEVEARGGPATSPGEFPSIAVLPFVNMGPDPEDEYLSDGFAEEVTNALAHVSGLRVASRTSAFAYKGRAVDTRRIGGELRVRTVLEGSVTRAGDRLRVTVQLIDTEEGYQLWSERFERDTSDIFAIQEEIARTIAQVLRLLLTEEEVQAIAAAPTTRVEAYEYYLRGRHFLHRFQRQSLYHAREMFDRAIHTDPEYALAFAGAADCSSFLYLYFDGETEHLTLAEEASRRAVELDPGLAEAHAARGLALALTGRRQEADAQFEQAIEQTPRRFEPYYLFARTCFLDGRLERAAELFEKACAIREDYQARVLRALALHGLGREEEARQGFEEALVVIGRHHELDPGDPRALTMGAECLARLGREGEALAWCRRAMEIAPEDVVATYSVACVDAVLGRHEEALAGLERALAGGFGGWSWARVDPDLAALRDHPRFKALVASGA